MIVNLHIERLVLNGLPVGSHEGPVIGAAVEAELTRLFADGGMAESFAGDLDVPLVRAAPILQPGSRTERLGTRIGQVIHGAISR